MLTSPSDKVSKQATSMERPKCQILYESLMIERIIEGHLFTKNELSANTTLTTVLRMLAHIGIDCLEGRDFS